MKGVFSKEGEAFTNSMNLIASLLVRYPSIATVSLEPEQKSLGFTFVVARPLTHPEFRHFVATVKKNLGVLADLLGQPPGLVEVKLSHHEGMSFLEVTRDIATLTPEEISLLTVLLEQEFGGALIREQEEFLEEEDKAFQEEMIGRMLEDLKDSRQERKLIGFREDGRVMVFNRATVQK
ncbi:MAG: hypothetical protein GX493_09420 [Firmicutes bacterium]|nr:hypothetical protein [Bacillota bacterium]